MNEKENGNKEKRGEVVNLSIPLETITIVLAVALVIVVVYNQLAINELGYLAAAVGASPENQNAAQSAVLSSIDVTPKGVPAVYGAELGISYDDVSAGNPQKADATIQKLAAYDTSIELDAQQLERYVKIAGQISCEYCCGADSIIFTKDSGQYKKGDAACGCAHSYAMRGLAKYLITQHGDEFTDDQILEELGKWKTLFFPDILAQKAAVLQDKGIELNYVNLASNKYRNIEAGTDGGGMVGGC
ncbi:MAG: hypothetical protein HYW26_05455 [Candidatus Aenigmarchaeota archaeon]|nr:hypothetical protein [Candidatus Aenigmarchaeota archaeon]